MVVLPLYRCELFVETTTLIPMGEQDWLETGHGAGDGLQPLVKGPVAAAGRVSIRQVLRGTDAPVTPRRRPRRRTKALVGWLVYSMTAVGGTAAAWTVRETLFPSLGAPPAPQLWGETNPVTTSPSPDTVAPSTSVVDTSVVTTTVLPAETAPAPIETVVQETAPPVAAVEEDNAPGTGTTLAAGPPANDPTPATPAPTAPASSVDDRPQTSPSSPETSDDSDDNSGKGKGGGGGGGSDDTTP